MSFLRTAANRLQAVLQYAPWAVLAYGIIVQLHVLITRFDQPLTGMFHFRESQTAISAYWMTQGGPKWIYETPVMGYPYTIPFEFPLFQWLAAGLNTVTGLSIDQSCRVVAFASFIGILWVFYRLSVRLGIDRKAYLIFAGLLCLSPLYLYWSSSALIESLALLLGLLWLLFYVRLLQNRRWIDFVLATLFGALAALEKITSFPAIVFIGFVLTLIHFGPKLREGLSQPVAFLREHALHGTLLLASVLLPIVATQFWVHAADVAKAQSVLGERVTSESLRTFNFATLAERMDIEQWTKVVYKRVTEHTLGAFFLVFVLIAAAFLRNRRLLIVSAISLGGYLVAFLLFWRLHQIHFYYQYANAFFLLVIAAVALREAYRSQAVIAVVATLIGLVGMHQTFDTVFGNNLKPANFTSGVESREIGAWVQANTGPDEALIVFARDWSSHFHHYALRKGVAVPAWTPRGVFPDLFENPDRFTGGAPVGAYVICEIALKRFADASRPEGERRIEAINAWVGDREPDLEVRTCKVYRADANAQAS